MGVALLFIDGVGVGRNDPETNPLAGAGHLLSQFQDAPGAPLPSNGVLHRVDTTFGVPGRPQSASNQTAILTGDPAPVLLGRHLLGFPNAFLADLLLRRSIVKRMVEAGRTATFANAYPVAYLAALELPILEGGGFSDGREFPARFKRRFKPSATTLSMRAAGVGLRSFEHAERGEAITNDLDGARARSRGMHAPKRTPEEAAQIFLSVSARHDFALFEHYLADEAGHARDRKAADQALSTFDSFARAVVENKPEGLHVFICSDHGNVEDLSTRSHTLNEVPVLYFGPTPEALPPLRTVADVGRAILHLLDVER